MADKQEQVFNPRSGNEVSKSYAQQRGIVDEQGNYLDEDGNKADLKDLVSEDSDKTDEELDQIQSDTSAKFLHKEEEQEQTKKELVTKVPNDDAEEDIDPTKKLPNTSEREMMETEDGEELPNVRYIRTEDGGMKVNTDAKINPNV